jgi:hypothetical protein
MRCSAEKQLTELKRIGSQPKTAHRAEAISDGSSNELPMLKMVKWKQPSTLPGCATFILIQIPT